MAAERIRSLLSLSLAAAMLVGTSPALSAQTTSYENEYDQYLESARHLPATPGLWIADLASDRIARRQNDLVTVRVLESLSATGSADSAVGKSSSAGVSLPTPTSKWLAKLFPMSTETDFTGSGGTTRTTELSAMLTARVSEVLPNGDLVIEGIREVDINGDRNVVVLTGVIRTADIQPGNVIVSTHIGQLRIRSLSQGLIHDSLEPGWLVRILNKVF
jgi:flagellar L-ring protein precursor FlgH